LPLYNIVIQSSHHRSVLYGGISVGSRLSSRHSHFPIFSAAVGAIIYLHQLDRKILVSRHCPHGLRLLRCHLWIPSRREIFSSSRRTVFSSPLIFLGRELQGLHTANLLLCLEASPRDMDSRLLYYAESSASRPRRHELLLTSWIVARVILTGESIAVLKEPGSRVIYGSLNLGGHP
jgi:hypothetical protein